MLCLVTQHVYKQELFLFISKDIHIVGVLLRVVFLSVLVNPCKEQILIALEVRLTHKHVPQLFDIREPNLYLILRSGDQEVKQAKHSV